MSDGLLTEWGERLDREHPLPEYPRPQMTRDSYICLNGVWQYAFTPGPTFPDVWEGEIVVPFSPEAPLSGVGRRLGREEYLQYRRTFALPDNFNAGRVLLHFGAVDQEAEVFMNGASAGRHWGGYLPFAFDVTTLLQAGENELRVTVRDDACDPRYGVGKQSYRPGGIWYTAQSGIWQTVWLESVPEVYIRSLRITPLYDEGRVKIEAETEGTPESLTADVYDGETFLAGSYFKNGTCVVPLPDFRSWSPESPFLYRLRVSAGADEVRSYFAMRKFSYLERDGHRVFALNNAPYFHNGLLDQGYWPDGLLTAPSDEALMRDIQTAKSMGFNMLRKHIKIEPLRWYYHCDRLGMLVWQDMVSGGGPRRPWLTSYGPLLGFVRARDGDYARFGRGGGESREVCLAECRGTVEHLYNCPCIALWTPFNEGWGQFDALRTARMVRELDPTRYIDHASGWHDQGWEEIKSRHVYFRPVRLRNDGRALCLTEFGGYTLPVPGHLWTEQTFGYRKFRSPEELERAYCRLFGREVLPCLRSQGLTASVYTQLSDVEQEANGLVTYDRKVVKIPPERLRALNERLRF